MDLQHSNEFLYFIAYFDNSYNMLFNVPSVAMIDHFLTLLYANAQEHKQ